MGTGMGNDREGNRTEGKGIGCRLICSHGNIVHAEVHRVNLGPGEAVSHQVVLACYMSNVC